MCSSDLAVEGLLIWFYINASILVSEMADEVDAYDEDEYDLSDTASVIEITPNQSKYQAIKFEPYSELI